MPTRMPSTSSVADVVNSLEESGYAIVENRVGSEVMDRLLDDVRPYGEKLDPLKLKFFGGGLKKVEAMITKSNAFVSLMADPFIHEITEEIIGPESLLNGSAVFLLQKGGRDQTLHYDGTIYEPMLPRTPGGPHYLINFMWAVTDFTAENGATRVVPGSHLWPVDRVPTENDTIEYLEMPRGSFAVWLGSSFHGSSINHTDTLRVGAQMGFSSGWLRAHEAQLLLVPPLVARDLPLNVQEVLGYRAHRGMLGVIEQQSPLECLGMVPAPWDSHDEDAHGPDPLDVEAMTRHYFLTAGQDMPSAVASELNQLSQTNAARSSSSREDDREFLETVGRAQSRYLVDHLLDGGFQELVEDLRQRVKEGAAGS